MKAGRALSQFYWLSGRWIRLEGLQMAELLFCEGTQSKQVLIEELMTLCWTVVVVIGFVIELSRGIEKKIHLDESSGFDLKIHDAMDMPCSSRPVGLALETHTDCPSSPSFGNALPLAMVMGWSCSFSQSCGSCDLWAQRGPFQGYAKVPQTQNLPLNYETLVKRSLSKSGISQNKSSTALIHFSKCNNAPFPLQLFLRNKGIKRDRNVLSFAQSWGIHTSCAAGKPAANSGAAVMCKLGARLGKETEWGSKRIIAPSLQSSNSCRPLGSVALSKLSGWKQDHFPSSVIKENDFRLFRVSGTAAAA